MRKTILILNIISFIFTGCATIRLQPVEIEDKKNNIEVKVEHNPEFDEFTAFKVTFKNNQSI